MGNNCTREMRHAAAGISSPARVPATLPCYRSYLHGWTATRLRMRVQELVSYERPQLGNLRELIRGHQPGQGFVLHCMVPDSPKIHQLTAERKAVACHSPEGRA